MSLKIPVVDDSNGSSYFFAELTAPDVNGQSELKLTQATLQSLSELQGAWEEGEGPPLDSNGADGEFYLNITNGDFYRKENGTWF